MKTTLQKTSTVRHKLSVEVPKDKVEKLAGQVLSKIQKDTAIKGFRKGEVPLDILRKYIGSDAEKEIIKHIIKETYHGAIRQESAFPISEPFIEHEQYEEGKDFIYHASFDVMPEVVAPEYEGLKLEKEKFEVTEAEVDAGLTRLQQSMTQLEPVTGGVVEQGMVAILDFKGTADGKSFKGSEAENFVIDYGNALKEFEEQIAGMRVGEERDITFTYPKDYFNKEAAGKKASFHVKVKEIRKKVVPEINDDFAKTVGQFQNLGEVREEVKKQIFSLKENYQKQHLADQAINKIVEKNQIEVPEVMISEELGAMLENVAHQLKSRGQTLEDAGVDAKKFVSENLKIATDRVRGYLIAFAISKQAAISASEEEVEARISLMARQAGQPVDKVKEHFKKEKLTDKLKSQMVYEKTLDFIVSKAKVKEVKKTVHST